MKVGKEERKRRKKKRRKRNGQWYRGTRVASEQAMRAEYIITGLEGLPGAVRVSLAASAWGLLLLLSVCPVDGSAFCSASHAVAVA